MNSKIISFKTHLIFFKLKSFVNFFPRIYKKNLRFFYMYLPFFYFIEKNSYLINKNKLINSIESIKNTSKNSLFYGRGNFLFLLLRLYSYIFYKTKYGFFIILISKSTNLKKIINRKYFLNLFFIFKFFLFKQKKNSNSSFLYKFKQLNKFVSLSLLNKWLKKKMQLIFFLYVLLHCYYLKKNSNMFHLFFLNIIFHFKYRKINNFFYFIFKKSKKYYLSLILFIFRYFNIFIFNYYYFYLIFHLFCFVSLSISTILNIKSVLLWLKYSFFYLNYFKYHNIVLLNNGLVRNNLLYLHKQFLFKPKFINLIWTFIFKSPYFEKVLNYLMRNGKKEIVERSIYSFFFYIKKKTGKTPFLFFIQSMNQIKPVFEFFSIRRFRKKLEVPKFITEKRQFFLSLKMVLNRVRKQSKPFFLKKKGKKINKTKWKQLFLFFKKIPFYVRLYRELILSLAKKSVIVNSILESNRIAYERRSYLRLMFRKKKIRKRKRKRTRLHFLKRFNITY